MSAPAQIGWQNTEASVMTATDNAAMKAFANGNWADAIAGLEQVINMVTDPKEQIHLGPAIYSLGAAYFNSGNYPKAISVLNLYLTKFPTGVRVGEARLAVARATFLNKDYDGAARLFAALEATPALREQSLLAQAQCYKELKKPDQQIAVLEKLIAPEIKSQAQANGALDLAQVYLDKQADDKVLSLLNKLQTHIAVVDNVVALNALTVKVGDNLAAKKKYAPALTAYRGVQSHDQVIAFQNQRIAAMDRQMQANLDAVRGNAPAVISAVGTNNEIKARQELAKKLLEEFLKLPDAGPAILFRMAKVYFDWGKKWEAIVVFDRLIAQYPQAKESETALYSTIATYADLNRVARTLELCDRYLAAYPTGINATTVGYIKGAAALQAGDPKNAVTYFGTTLQTQPDSQFREQMRFLLGNAHFVQGQFEDARNEYLRYLRDFPKGQFSEESQYREALTYIFEGKYEEGLAKMTAYLQQFPDGAFAADAGYRMMVCKYAASLYDEVIDDGKKWLLKYPKDQITGEVLALLGDAYAGTDKHEEAAAAYTSSYKKATTDEVLNYSLFEASKQLQKLGKWPEVDRLFEDFVHDKPDNPTVVAATFWISKAKAHEGKTEEAKTFLVEQLEHYISEPKREAVEQLLQQLAQLCAKRPRPAAPLATPTPTPEPVAVAPAGSPAASPPVVPTPTPLPPYDAVAELKKQLSPLATDANNTVKARLLYAEAELDKIRKKDAEAEDIYDQIATSFQVEELSPVLLALVGDHLLAKGDSAQAAKFYEELREDYPKSDYLDYAFVGLGELALAKKDNKKALELFSHAADDIPGAKIKEATIGKARALLNLGRYDEAKKLFEQVAGVREWRGESTALAMYYLGEVEERQGHWAEAIAHYQRVFVAYQKYLPWTAKAYLSSAESFDKMGKRSEAIKSLQEMLRNEKLKNLPETIEARKILGEWGGTA